MAHTTRLENGIIMIAFSDMVTIDEVVAYAHELAQLEAGLAISPDRLTDLSAIKELHLNFHAIDRFKSLRSNARLKNPVRSAILAPRDVQYGFARMFQTLCDHPQIRVEIFKDEASARAWLAGNPPASAAGV